MSVKSSGRVHKFLLDVGASPPEGRTLDKLQLFLPDGSAVDLSGGGAETPPAFNPRGDWVAGEYDQGDAVMVDSASYWASETTSEEPGVTGAPLTPDDLFQTIWADDASPLIFATTDGSAPQAAEDPWTADQYSTFLYIPVTNAGHMQIALDTYLDHYVSYLLVKGSDMSLQASGSSDTSLGFDLDTVGDWYVQLYHDAGFDAGHDPGPVTGTVVFSAGLIVTPAPAGNPWIQF